MSEKPRTAEQARVLFRQIVRELPEAERDRLISFAGIADRPDTAEDAIEFFKEMVAKLPSDELSELNVEFRSGLDGQDDSIFVASLPDEADYAIIPNEIDGADALVVLRPHMWQDLMRMINQIEKQRNKDWLWMNDIIKRVLEREKDLYQSQQKLRRCSDVIRAKTARRHELIAQAIGAGMDEKDAEKIWEFVRQEDASVLFKSKKSREPDLDPDMMMLMYKRSRKRSSNNCNSSE